MITMQLKKFETQNFYTLKFMFVCSLVMNYEMNKLVQIYNIYRSNSQQQPAVDVAVFPLKHSLVSHERTNRLMFACVGAKVRSILWLIISKISIATNRNYCRSTPAA